MGPSRGPREDPLIAGRHRDPSAAGTGADRASYTALVAGRRMCRSFAPTPIDATRVDAVLDAGRRAPAAGNTAALHYLVLDEPAATARYWDTTLPAARRATFAWPRLLAAPVLAVVLVDPAAYLARYQQPDKAHSSLGADLAAWPIPYWFVDGGMAVMAMLLAAEADGLGALFFGLFEHEADVAAAFGVPSGLRAVGTVALGEPHSDQRRSRSVKTRRPRLDDIVHRGHWRLGR